MKIPENLNSSIPEEIELMKIKQDYIIEYDELVAYNTLLHIAEEIPDLPQKNDIIKSLKETIQEEQSMVYWFQVHTPLVADTLWPKLINFPIKRSQLFLLTHTGLREPLIIMYADIVGSTKMSMTLSVEDLVLLIRAFTFEISKVVESYDGYVLKYSGDAVISFFPSINIDDNKHQLSKKSVECAKSIINAIKKEINSMLNEKYGYPEILVKIGIDEGENAVIQYGYEKNSPIDILGYSMNVASKITSLTAPNSISIGENLYNLLDYELQSEFKELPISSDKWKYINRDTKKSYRIYIQR
jgi:adenylate cyclase